MTTMIYAESLKVAIAANVSYASKELIATFNKHYPDIKVQVILGGSGKLTAQIKHGAPYDIFMSADMQYPQALYRDKLAITKPHIYSRGALVLFTTKEIDLSSGIQVVQSDAIKRVAIANPKTAPYGKATIEALQNAHIEFKSKAIYGESISQTVSYAMTATDIGFIAKSSLYSPHMSQYKEHSHWIELSPKLYTPIDQGIVILKRAENNSAAKAFYEFILSTDAQDLFKRYGYIIN